MSFSGRHSESNNNEEVDVQLFVADRRTSLGMLLNVPISSKSPHLRCNNVTLSNPIKTNFECFEQGFLSIEGSVM